MCAYLPAFCSSAALLPQCQTLEFPEWPRELPLHCGNPAPLALAAAANGTSPQYRLPDRICRDHLEPAVTIFDYIVTFTTFFTVHGPATMTEVDTHSLCHGGGLTLEMARVRETIVEHATLDSQLTGDDGYSGDSKSSTDDDRACMSGAPSSLLTPTASSSPQLSSDTNVHDLSAIEAEEDPLRAEGKAVPGKRGNGANLHDLSAIEADEKEGSGSDRGDGWDIPEPRTSRLDESVASVPKAASVRRVPELLLRCV